MFKYSRQMRQICICAGSNDGYAKRLKRNGARRPSRVQRGSSIGYFDDDFSPTVWRTFEHFVRFASFLKPENLADFGF